MQELQFPKTLHQKSPPVKVALGTLEARDASELVEGASRIAKTLADIVRRQNLSVQIQGREFVRCEGWTTLGIMLGILPREVEVREENGRYIATVELVRISDGLIVTRASAECGPDEQRWKQAPKFQRRSMALTRATGKACRLAFSWVMALAGFETTPAEEIIDVHGYGGNGSSQSTKARINEAQHRALEARIRELAQKHGLLPERLRGHVKAFVHKKEGAEHLNEISPRMFRELMDGALEAMAKWLQEKNRVE